MQTDSADRLASRTRSPLRFFLLVFALSIPFWLLGFATGLQLLPGLPISALAFVCPATAALILVRRESGKGAAIQLLKRSFDYERIKAKAWYAPVILLIPGANVLAYAVMRLMGESPPAPQIPVLAAPAMFLSFFVAALGEELGWSGYVTDPMQDRWGALRTGILLGLVWAAWHVIALVQAHRPPEWIALWSLYTVASRVLMVWIYNNTGGSVFAAALYHAVSNLSWQLFPDHGSHWDPRVIGPVVAIAAAIVTVIWTPRAPTRDGQANPATSPAPGGPAAGR